jgi:hypothetical protein
LKDKVAALVYADSGTGSNGLCDAGALDLLVLSTSAWLEVNSLRKQAHKEPSPPRIDNHSAANAEAHQTAVHAVSAYTDPFASQPSAHPALSMAAAASSSEVSAPAAISAEVAPPESAGVAHVVEEAPGPIAQSQYAPVESPVAETDLALSDPLPIGQAAFDSAHTEAAVAQTVADVAAASSLSPEDQDVHRKAQRFARLLVDEIKLYNQANVADGRKNRDLYDRLKEVIEKSRVTYQKRYGTTVASSANYFQHEIIRSLAEDDPSVMGANFRQ